MFIERHFALILVTIWAGVTVVNIMLRYRTSLGEKDRPLRIIAVLLVGIVYAGFVFARMLWPGGGIAWLLAAVILLTLIQSSQRFISAIWAWVERWKDLKRNGSR